MARRLPLALASLLLVVRAATVPASCSATRSCTAALNDAVAACAGAPCAINLEAGTYVLEGAEYGPRVVIAGARGLSITGAGDATVLVANISTLFSVTASAGVAFARFAVDMERVPFTAGRVVAASASSSSVAFDATGLYRVELARHPWLNRAQAIVAYDPVMQRFGPGTDIYALDAPIPVAFERANGTDGLLHVATQLPVGEFVVLRHQVYANNAFTVSASTDLAWTNVSLWAVGGMGIFTNSCTGIAIDGLSIVKRPGRPMSITADGVHLSNTRGGSISVRRSVFEGQGDDGLNAPTLFQFILSLAPDRRSFQVGGRDAAAGAAAPYLRVGDTAQFFARATLLPLGAATVVGVGPNHTVTLSAPVPPGVGVYDAVDDAQQYAATLEVTDCVFRANRARGVLLKQSNVLCARNVFDGMTASAAKTETNACHWMEGHPVTNWSFVDNTIREVNVWGGFADVAIDNSVPVFAHGAPTTKCVPYTLATPGAAVQRGLNISHNTFTQLSGMPAISVYSTDGAELRGNTVNRAAGAPVPAVDLQGFGVVHAALAGNVCDARTCVVAGMGAREPAAGEGG